MAKKLLSGLATSVLMAGLASAQVSGGAGGFQGILPLISNILGLDLGNPYAVIGMLSTLAVMDGAVYVIFKVGAEKMDIKDTVMPGGHDEGRNILLILSTLVTLSIFGSGAAAGLISGFQSMFILGFTFILLGGMVFVLFGGSGLVVGGGSYAAGKSMKATAEGVQEGAEALEKADNILSTAEKEEKEGKKRGDSGDKEGERKEEKDAEKKVEKVTEILDSAEDDFGDAAESDRITIQNAINDFKEALKDEKMEGKAEEDIENRVLRASQNLAVFSQKAEEMAKKNAERNGVTGVGIQNNAVQLTSKEESDLIEGRDPFGQGKSALTDDHITGGDGVYGLKGILQDLELVEKRINLVTNNLGEEEDDLDEGLHELLQAAKEAVELHKDTKELQGLLKEVEEDTKYEEKLTKNEKFQNLFQEARNIEKYEKEDLEPKLKRIEEEESKLFEGLEEADKLIKKHMSLDDEVIGILEERVSEEYKSMKDDFNSILFITEEDSDAQNVINNILQIIKDLGDKLENIDSELNQEKRLEKEEIDKLEQYLKEDSKNNSSNSSSTPSKGPFGSVN